MILKTLKFETSLPVQTGPAPDDFVLPKKFTKGKANRGPGSPTTCGTCANSSRGPHGTPG